MIHTRILGTALSAWLVLAPAAHAADEAATADGKPPAGAGMQHGAMHDMMHGKDGTPMSDDDMMGRPHGRGAHGAHKCMHGDMMKMGGMMMPAMVPVPMLPPGNAKLQVQMQAEIMQKVGEIVARYAQQVKEPPPPAP